MATRKPLVIVSGVTQQIADADAISANGGVQRGTAGALALGTDANTTSVNLGTNASVTAMSLGTGMGIGDTILIGGIGSTTQIQGDLQVDGTQTFVGGSTFQQDATFEGNVTFGNAATDTVGFLSRVGPVANPDIHFVKELNHSIDVDASTTLNAAGAALSVAAGNGNGTGVGGNFNVDAGSGSTGGLINVGATFASSINIGGIVANPTVTFLGTGDVVKSGAGALRLSGGSNQIELGERGSDPITAANVGALYTKDVGTFTELFFRSDSSGLVTQLTGVTPAASDLDSVLAVGNTTGTSATTSGANIVFSGDGVQQDSIVVGGQAGQTFSIAFSGAATGAGAPVSISAQQGGAASAGGQITITAGGGGSGSGAGGALTLTAGSGSSGTGDGGLATLRGGLAISGAGGGASVLGRDGAGGGAGGAVTVTAGAGNAAGFPGNVVVTAGAGGSTAGGSASLIGGAGGTGSGNNGGFVVVRGGHTTAGLATGGALSLSGGTGTSFGGAVTLTGGAGGTTGGIGGAMNISGGVGGNTGGAGGTCTVSGGPSQALVAGGSLVLEGGACYAAGLAGGPVTMRGGASTNGNGGGVTIHGGDGAGPARSGGALTMRGGAATTTGTPGDAGLTGGAAVTTASGGFGRVMGGVGGVATGATPGGAGGFGRAQGGVGGAAAGGAGAGGAGGTGSALGGTGGAGTATGIAGAGGAANLLAGNAGANGGAGGANGGSVNIEGGQATGAGANGIINIGVDAISGRTSQILIGNGTQNPSTTFQGTGTVRLGAGFEEFANGVAAAVSPAGEGRLRYNNTTSTFQVSISGAAYVDLATGGAESLSATLAVGNTTGANDIQFNGADGGPGDSIIIQDAYASALRIREGSNSYLMITTTNAAEQITFGNNTINPEYSFRGSGAVEIQGTYLNLTEEIAHTVRVLASTTLNAAGAQLNVEAGEGNGTGTGGELLLLAGAGGATGDGGDSWLRGGAATSGAGGLVSVVGGGTAAGTGGAASIDGGLGTVNNGNILIGTNQVNDITIGNTSDNPVTSFQGTGDVRLTGTNQYLSLIGSGAGTGGGKLSIFESGNVTPGANTGIVYTKDDAGDTELFYADPAGNYVQITKDGVVNAGSSSSNSIIITGLTTTGVTSGHAVYVSGASTVTACDANGTAAQATCFGFYEGTSGSVKTAGVVAPVFDAAPTAGDRIYLSLTAGQVTATAPSTTGDYVAPVGIALTTTTMLIQILTPVQL